MSRTASRAQDEEWNGRAGRFPRSPQLTAFPALFIVPASTGCQEDFRPSYSKGVVCLILHPSNGASRWPSSAWS